MSEREAELAVAVLEDWNRQAGQRLTSGEWLSRIVMRIREYPDLAAGDHSFVIAKALAAPWWKGDATPNVVYGNGAVFEKALLLRQTGGAGDRSRVGPGGAPTASAILEEAIEQLRREAGE